MNKLAIWLILLAVISVPCYSQAASPNKFVPGSETAIALAKVILNPIYGKKFVQGKIFDAKEQDGVWIIIGRPKVPPGKIAKGGEIEVRISVADARVSYLHLSL